MTANTLLHKFDLMFSEIPTCELADGRMLLDVLSRQWN